MSTTSTNVGGWRVGVGDDVGGLGEGTIGGGCRHLRQTISGGVVDATIGVGTIGGIPV